MTNELIPDFRLSVKSLLPQRYSIASGIIWTLVSPLWGFWWLGPIVLVPLLYFACASSSRFLILKEAFWTQMIFGLGTFFWIPLTMQNLWQSPMLANWLFFLILVSFSQIPILILAAAIGLLNIQKLTLWNAILLSCFFSFVESVFPKFLNDTYGCILAGRPNILSYFQFPFGTYLMTFVVMIANFTIVMFVQRRRSRSLAAFYLFVVGLIFLLPIKAKRTVAPRSLDVVAVNTNLSVDDLHNPAKAHGVAQEVIGVLQSLPERRSEKQIVVFPETVYPLNLLDPMNADNQILLSVVKSKNLHLLIGSRIDDGRQKMNGTVYVHFDGDLLKTEYIAKRILFPFGERIPLLEYFPFLKDKIGPPMLYDIPEQNREYFNIFDFKITSIICYESIFPSLLRQMKGPIDLALNPSNEIYFPRFGEPQLSLGMTVLNSSENRIPILRVSNGGLGGLVQEMGVVDPVSAQQRFEITNYHLLLGRADQ